MAAQKKFRLLWRKRLTLAQQRSAAADLRAFRSAGSSKSGPPRLPFT
jgi:hypothetical protein